MDQAAEFHVCCLQDTAKSLQQCMSGNASISAAANGHGHGKSSAVGIVSYTPVGEEALFDGLLPAGFSLIPQRGETFDERLLFTAQDIFAAGYGSVCLIDSDSPTVPTAAYQQAIEILNAPGDRKKRIVLGPSEDGGYYLIGLTHPHPKPFSDIAWSTSTVAAETRERCHSADLTLVELPRWYDIDDAEALAILTAELLDNTPPPFATDIGYTALCTRALLRRLRQASTTS
jgi:glycosyltransferase A (GT-A) superfamily protein (DUF2064 family)